MDNVYILDDKVEFHPEANLLVSCANKSQTLSLHGPVAKCLLLLIHEKGNTVTQQRFLDDVWIKNGYYTSANTLYQNIFQLRNALKKLGLGAEVVKTLPRRGFLLSSRTKIVVIPNTPHAFSEQSTASCAVAGDAPEEPSSVAGKDARERAQTQANLTVIWTDVTASAVTANRAVEKDKREELSLPYALPLAMEYSGEQAGLSRTGEKRRLKYKDFLYTISGILLLALISIPFLIMTNSDGHDWVARYVPVPTNNNCNILVRKEFDDLDRYQKLIDEKLGNCQSGYYYVSSINNSAKYSIIECTEALTHAKGNYCVTKYYIEG